MRPRWPLSGRWLLRGREACGSRCGFRCCWRLPRGQCMWAIACSTLLPGCASLRSTRCASATDFIGVTGARFCPWPLPRLAPPRESSLPSCRPWPARETRYWPPRLWLISPACTRAATRGNSRSSGRAPFPARNFWWACCLPRGACCPRGIGRTLSPRRVPRSGSSGFPPLPSPLWRGSIAVASRGGSRWMNAEEHWPGSAKDVFGVRRPSPASNLCYAIVLALACEGFPALRLSPPHRRIRVPPLLLAAGATSALLLALLDRTRARILGARVARRGGFCPAHAARDSSPVAWALK